MIFRWSIWGDYISKNIELLGYSISTFKKQFGKDHHYIVYTDNVDLVLEHLDDNVDVRKFPSGDGVLFNINSKATWMKWCPAARLDVGETEFFVDSDVFLLRYPKEIDSFLANDKQKFAIMDEYFGQSWQHGAMSRKATPDTPFVNAGLFIQKAGYDISPGLTMEYEWWKNNIKPSERTHHDEQGALALALTVNFVSGELCVLPKDKYMLIGENENTDIDSLDNVTLFHAVYPDHPAFYRFKSYLDGLIK